MIREKNIKWFLQDPTRFLQMKPFTRGGHLNTHGYENSPILNNTTLETGFANLTLKPISQDTYITEYRPDLHHIIMNRSIPHIKVAIDGCELPLGMLDMTQTASQDMPPCAAQIPDTRAKLPAVTSTSHFRSRQPLTRNTSTCLRPQSIF